MGKKTKEFVKSNAVNLEEAKDIEEFEEDEYKKYGCDYLNESVCRELLEEDGLDVDEVVDKHFSDD